MRRSETFIRLLFKDNLARLHGGADSSQEYTGSWIMIKDCSFV